MQTNHSTTYILLDRGSEDKALLEELNKITAATGINSIKEFIQEFPTIQKLKQELTFELNQEEN
jgi:hypothetical protein